jgi:hypothetical protein
MVVAMQCPRRSRERRSAHEPVRDVAGGSVGTANQGRSKRDQQPVQARPTGSVRARAKGRSERVRQARAPVGRGASPSFVGFIRYVVSKRDPSSGCRRGFLREAGHLHRRGVFLRDSARARELIDWFDSHLRCPDRLSRTRNASHKRKRALSWFKDTAPAHIERARELVGLMEANDVLVQMLVTDRPGYVVYEDDHQVVAEPFADTNR